MPNDATQFLFFINAFFFFIYGIQALFSKKMKGEFKRFGLTDRQRMLVGILQISGSTGMIAGFIYPIIGFLASSGFTAMMLIAFFVRIKIKDSLAQALPSLIFMLINIWVAIAFYELL